MVFPPQFLLYCTVDVCCRHDPHIHISMLNSQLQTDIRCSRGQWRSSSYESQCSRLSPSLSLSLFFNSAPDRAKSHGGGKCHLKCVFRDCMLELYNTLAPLCNVLGEEKVVKKKTHTLTQLISGCHFIFPEAFIFQHCHNSPLFDL